MLAPVVVTYNCFAWRWSGKCLEEALEPMLEALCAAALEHAQSQGREEILEEDLRAVSKKIMAKK